MTTRMTVRDFLKFYRDQGPGWSHAVGVDANGVLYDVTGVCFGFHRIDQNTTVDDSIILEATPHETGEKAR